MNKYHKQLTLYNPKGSNFIEYDLCTSFDITNSTNPHDWEWKILCIRDFDTHAMIDLPGDGIDFNNTNFVATIDGIFYKFATVDSDSE